MHPCGHQATTAPIVAYPAAQSRGRSVTASPHTGREAATNATLGSHISLQFAGMHPSHVRAEALALVEAGLNDCEVSRRLGIPRRTILDWRRPRYVSRRKTPLETCPAAGEPPSA